jgi:uncharacterized membrane protein
MCTCLLLFTDIHYVETRTQYNQSTTSTTFSGCSTTKQGNMFHIVHLLTQLNTQSFAQTLITLHLSSNKIGAVGAQHFADVLRINTVILILSSSISYAYLHFLTQTLTTLDLSYNQIAAVGAQHLADTLRNNTVTLIFSSSFS